jgi:hypothetical protein
MNTPRVVQTRGGLLVGLVIMAVIGFELRTVVGMLFGVDIPATPYVIAMIALLSIVGVLIDVSRTAKSEATGR